MKNAGPVAAAKTAWYRKLKIAGILCIFLAVCGCVITYLSGAAPNILLRVGFSGILAGIVMFLLGRAIERKMKFKNQSVINKG
jgi:membrane protein YqaA with SNARE-associated domain